MKLVAKPDGYDLRARRATNTVDACNWLPEDALFSASEEMATTKKPTAFVMAWYYFDKEGTQRIAFRFSGQTSNDITACAAELFHIASRPCD